MIPKKLLATFLVFCLAPFIQGLRLPGECCGNTEIYLNTIEEETDLDQFMKEQSDTEFAENSVGNYKKWPPELLGYMQNSQWTDCVFTVGPDGKEEKIKAHAVILAIASPVLNLALRNSTSFRLKEWHPSEFKTILRMIYSEGTCFKNIDEACNLMRLARSLKLEFVFEAAQKYIGGHMHPHRYWDAFICARQASAGKLLLAVNQVINANTSKFMKDPGFKKISSADLANILARDDITVRSEVELYTFVMNWAMEKVKETGQRASTEILKEKIGSDALKYIRFLTMTALEYTTLHNILDFEDSLAVRQNILNPGITEMPAYLSSSRIKRKELVNATEETFTSVVLDEKCEGYSEKKSVYDQLTTLSFYNCPFKLAGIQIPKSLESRNDCHVKEHFDVFVLNPENEVVYKHAYDQAPPCTSLRLFVNISDSGIATAYTNVNDETLIDVKFKQMIEVSRSDSGKQWRVKVVYRDVKKYPLFIRSEDEYEHNLRTPWSTCTNTTVNFMGLPGYTNYVIRSDSFVYGFYVEGPFTLC